LDRRILAKSKSGRLQLQACVLKNDGDDDDAPMVEVRSAKSDDSCGSACKLCRGRQKPHEMLQCEGVCSKYFHVWCVGLRSVPKGRWQCSACSSTPALKKGSRPRKAKQTASSKKHEEDMQARRQWKMAMGIAAVGDEDGPALSDSDDSGVAPAAEDDDAASDADDKGESAPIAGRKVPKVVGFGFTTPTFFDCTQTLRPGRKTWEEVGRVSEEALKHALNTLPEQFVQERDILLAKHEEMFPWWHYMLAHGFNLLLYGVGSKRRILDSLSHTLTDGVVISVQAYMPAFRAKFMLLALCQALKLEHSVHATNSALVGIILSSLSPPPPSAPSASADSLTEASDADRPTTRAAGRVNLVAQLKKVYILIYGFDSQQYHGGELISALASLAQSPKIGLVCGCDHVNAALLITAEQRRLMRFMWVQAMTFDPYTQELNSSAQSSGITVEHMQGSLAVLRALPLNSQKIVFALVRMQLASGGATYAELLDYGRQYYLVTSDAALKNILVGGCHRVQLCMSFPI
jgi:origin recognition complex subunit 2